MIHRHLIVRGRGRARLDANDVKSLLLEVIDVVHMRVAKVRGNPVVYDCPHVGNEGVTVACVMAVIETSHCVMHTWTALVHPLILYQFDLFSCAHFDPSRVCWILKDRLDLVTFERLLVDRTVGLEVL